MTTTNTDTDTYLSARLVGDIRALTNAQRAIIDQIDLFGARRVSALVATLTERGLTKTKKAAKAVIADMVEAGQLAPRA